MLTVHRDSSWLRRQNWSPSGVVAHRSRPPGRGSASGPAWSVVESRHQAGSEVSADCGQCPRAVENDLIRDDRIAECGQDLEHILRQDDSPVARHLLQLARIHGTRGHAELRAELLQLPHDEPPLKASHLPESSGHGLPRRLPDSACNDAGY
jgi:hypothetical protein